MKRKVLSMVLCFVMLLSLLPTMAWAESQMIEVTSETELVAACAVSGTEENPTDVCIMNDITLNAGVYIQAEGKIVIHGKTGAETIKASDTFVGYAAAKGPNMFYSNKNTEIVFEDITLDANKAAGVITRIIEVGTGTGIITTLVLNNGAVLKNANSGSQSGGGVFVRNNAKMVMDGAIIKNCESDGNGGGIQLSGSGMTSAINMKSGTIEGCVGRYAGGLCGYGSSEMIISGGLFKDNYCKTDWGCAGAIFINGSPAIMSGTIQFSNNTEGTNHDLGDVHCNSSGIQLAGPLTATFSLSDPGPIQNGGIYISPYEDYVITEDDIKDIYWTKPAQEMIILKDGNGVNWSSISITYNADSAGENNVVKRFPANLEMALQEISFTNGEYTLAGWTTDNAGNGTFYADKAAVTLTADTDLYAKWVSRITFDKNATSATCSATSTDIAYNTAYDTSLPTPALTGYDFLGWYSEAQGGTKVVSTDKPTGNATLYAHWKKTESTAVANEGKVEVDASDAIEAIIPTNTANMETLQIVADIATVNFDATATAKIKENAESGMVDLTVESPENATNALAFADAVSGKTAAKIININMVANGSSNAVYDSSNAAGKATVGVPYTKPVGGGEVVAYSLNGSTATPVSCSYDATNEIATLTLEHFSEYVIVTKAAPVYSGGDPTYAVTTTDTTHGSVTASCKNASGGSTVTLTVKPDKGWTLETLTVKDKNGKEIDLTAKKVGETYTFKMPSSAVTVAATFMEDNTMLNYFVDVKADDYCYDAVLWAAENGITNGADNLRFAPQTACDRGQVVTFLWRAFGSPAATKTSDFADVPAHWYFADAVAWAAEKGITTGTDKGFEPFAITTRAQVVTFLWRTVGSPAAKSAESFADVPANEYYAAAVAWAVENGITTGTDKGFEPNAKCDRGQIVTFLYRYFVK